MGLASLSLLQQIFPTQELNWSLLQHRQILYQLSYQGSLTEYITPQLKKKERGTDFKFMTEFSQGELP